MTNVWHKAKAALQRHPNPAMAAMVFLLGLLAIKLKLPTEDGCTTLAGALFGSGAAFIGAWVAERKKATEDATTKQQRKEVAKAFFTPELARVIHVQIGILSRITVNFSTTSMGRPPIQEDTLASFRPRRPLLYPMASEFKDLTTEDASALIEFYDLIQGIDETITSWMASKQRINFNAFNMLQHMVKESLESGQRAIERFCPDRSFGRNYPASGTLASQVQRVIASADQAMKSHLDRNTPGNKVSTA